MPDRQEVTAITSRDVPRQPQRQDALQDQLADLYMWAVRLGMYDAAEWLWQRRPAAEFPCKRCDATMPAGWPFAVCKDCEIDITIDAEIAEVRAENDRSTDV